MLDQARSAQVKSDPRLSATFALRWSRLIEHDITPGTAFFSPRISMMVLFFVQGSIMFILLAAGIINETWLKKKRGPCESMPSQPAHFGLCDLVQDVNATFHSNRATVAGGAIFADDTSSTADLSEALEFATNIGSAKVCFLNTTNLTLFDYNGTSADGKVGKKRLKNSLQSDGFFSWISCL